MRATWRSFAKINLHLEVLGRRADGFHELLTVFQTVSLHDRVTVELTSGGIELEARGEPVPTDAENLCWRAAAAFLERWGEGRGVRMELDKRIPVGGGLGGGSSDAATVLAMLAELTGRPGRAGDLVEVAAELGSDVPYFLVGGTALGTGRGELVEPLSDLAEEEVWIIDPGIRVSTREVFSAGGFDERPPDEEVIARWRRGGATLPSEAVGENDLEPRVLALYEPVEAVYTALVHSGAERVRVTGSGAAVFAFAGSLDERSLAASVPDARRFRARTLSRRSIATRRVVHSMEGP